MDSLAVKLCGPVGPYAVGIDAHLAGLGYTWRSRGVSLKLVEHLSVWMLIRGFGVEDLTRGRLQEFVVIYRAQFAAPVTVGTLMPAMDYLRDQGLVPPERAARVDDPVLLLLEAFGRHLVEERLIGEKSARSYALAVRPLLEALAGGADGSILRS